MDKIRIKYIILLFVFFQAFHSCSNISLDGFFQKEEGDLYFSKISAKGFKRIRIARAGLLWLKDMKGLNLVEVRNRNIQNKLLNKFKNDFKSCFFGSSIFLRRKGTYGIWNNPQLLFMFQNKEKQYFWILGKKLPESKEITLRLIFLSKRPDGNFSQKNLGCFKSETFNDQFNELVAKYDVLLKDRKANIIRGDRIKLRPPKIRYAAELLNELIAREDIKKKFFKYSFYVVAVIGIAIVVIRYVRKFIKV